MSLVNSIPRTIKLSVGGVEESIPHNNDYSRVFVRDSIASACDIHKKFDMHKDSYQRKSLQGIGNGNAGLTYNHLLDDRCNCILCWIHKKKFTPFSLPTKDAKIACVADQLRGMRLHRHMPFSQFRYLVDTILPPGSVIADPEMMAGLYSNIWFRLFDSPPLNNPIPLKSFLSDHTGSRGSDPSVIESVKKMQAEEDERYKIEIKRYDLYKNMKAGKLRERHTALLKRVLKKGPVLDLVGSGPSESRQITTLQGIEEGFASDMKPFFKQKFRCEYILNHNDVQSDLIEWINTSQNKLKYYYLDTGFVSEAQEVYEELYKSELKQLINESVVTSFDKFMNNNMTPMFQEYENEFYTYEFEYYKQVVMSILDDDNDPVWKQNLRDTLDVINDEYTLAKSIQNSNLKRPRSRINYLEEYRKHFKTEYGVSLTGENKRFNQLLSRRRKRYTTVWTGSYLIEVETTDAPAPKRLTDVDIWLKQKKSLSVEDVSIVTAIFRQMPPQNKKWMLAYNVFEQLKKRRANLDVFALQMMDKPKTRNMKEFQDALNEKLNAKMQLYDDQLSEKMQVVFEWLSEDSRQSILRQWSHYKYITMRDFMNAKRIKKKKLNDKTEFEKYKALFSSQEKVKEKYNEKGGFREQRKMEIWYNGLGRYQNKWDLLWKNIEKNRLPKFKVKGAQNISDRTLLIKIKKKLKKIYEESVDEMKIEISIMLDIQHETFNSFKDDQKVTAIDNFLRKNLPPHERDEYVNIANKHWQTVREIKRSLDNNKRVLVEKKLSEEQKLEFQESISRANGYLEDAVRRFKAKQLDFKNEVFIRLTQKKLEHMFIKKEASYSGTDYWKTRNHYMSKLLKLGTQVFALDCSSLLDTWNKTTFQIGEVSDKKINDFLMSFFSMNDIGKLQDFRAILEEYNKCGRDFLVKLAQIEILVLKEIQVDNAGISDAVVQDSKMNEISQFALEINPDNRINIEDVISGEGESDDLSIIKTVNKVGVELNTDYNYFQFTPVIKKRIESIRSMIEIHKLGSDISVELEICLNDYERGVRLFQNGRDYLKLMSLSKEAVYNSNNIVKAWITGKHGDLVTVDVETSEEVNREITNGSSVFTIKEKVLKTEQKTLHTRLCFDMMQDFEWLLVQIDLKKFQEATAEQQEFREMKNIERQKQEIVNRILEADLLNEKIAREEEAEEKRIDLVRDNIVAQDLLFEEWSAELLTAQNSGLYVRKKIEYCKKTPHEAMMFLEARSRWVSRVNSMYAQRSDRPEDVQEKFTKTGVLQRRISSFSRIKQSNIETAFYRKLMLYMENDEIVRYLQVQVDDKIDVDDKLAELKRLQVQFKNAITRYDEKLRRGKMTLRQKPLEKRKQILLEFDKLDKQIRQEFTEGLLTDTSEEVKKYYRYVLPRELETIMYTPPEIYTMSEWGMDVERSYAPLNAFIWEILKQHVTREERRVPYGTRTRLAQESDFERLFLVERNRKRYLPETETDLLYEIEKITPPTSEMSSFNNPVRLAWGPGSWFDIDVSCDIMRHTGLSFITRKRIEQRIGEQYDVEKKSYTDYREKNDLTVELNKISDTLTKNALNNVIRQVTREQAGEEICKVFDAFQSEVLNRDDLSSEDQFKLSTYESIENTWSNKIKNWKSDGKNIRLPDDIVGSFSIDRTTGMEVRTSGDYHSGVVPTHMRLHHFYLEAVENRGKITLVPFFIVSLYKKRNNFQRLAVRNRAHRTFLINEQDKYAHLDVKVSKIFSQEDYKGFKHSLCLNLDEFTQLISKPSFSGKKRMTRNVPFPLLNKYHMLLQDIKIDTIKRKLIENKKTLAEISFSEPAVEDKPSDDPNKPFKGIIRTQSHVSDIYVSEINGVPFVIVAGHKTYILNSDGVLVAEIATDERHLKNVKGNQIVTYRKRDEVFVLTGWSLLDSTEMVRTPYQRNLDYFGSIGGALDKFISFGDGNMHVWECSELGELEFQQVAVNVTTSPLDMYVSYLFRTPPTEKRIPLISWKHNVLIYAYKHEIIVLDNTFSIVTKLRGHEEDVTCLGEGDGIIVSGSDDKNLIIWSSAAHSGISKGTGIYYEELYSYIKDDSDSENEDIKQKTRSFKSFGKVKKVSKNGEYTIVLKRSQKNNITRKLTIIGDYSGKENQIECTYQKESRVVRVRISASSYQHVLSGHTAGITNVICKDMVYSASKDNTIRIWQSNGLVHRVLTLQTLDLDPLLSMEDIKIAVMAGNKGVSTRLFYAFGPHVGAYDVQLGKRVVFDDDVVRLDYESGWTSDEESENDEGEEGEEEIKEKTDLDYFREAVLYVNTTVLENPTAMYDAESSADSDSSEDLESIYGADYIWNSNQDELK